MAAADQKPPPPGDPKRVEYLENFIADNIIRKYRSEDFAKFACDVLNMIGPDMSVEEDAAAWTLIRFAKRRDRELRPANPL
jgi:hypothetical protein